MPTFRLDPTANTAGTSNRAQLDLAPAALVARFGPPGRGTDDAKVSGQYTFVDDAGNPFTLYDWKCTSIWEVAEGHAPSAEDATLPTPEEFWALDFPVPLNVGGKPDAGDVGAFVGWLRGGVD